MSKQLSGWKHPNHTVELQNPIDLQYTEFIAISSDTGSQADLVEMLRKPYAPQYSGDIEDMTYKGLQEITTELKASVIRTQKLKSQVIQERELDDFRDSLKYPTPEPTKTEENE